jgi:hypothetical protein
MTIDFIQREFAYLAGAFVTLFFIIDPLATVRAIAGRFAPNLV